MSLEKVKRNSFKCKFSQSLLQHQDILDSRFYIFQQPFLVFAPSFFPRPARQDQSIRRFYEEKTITRAHNPIHPKRSIQPGSKERHERSKPANKGKCRRQITHTHTRTEGESQTEAKVDPQPASEVSPIDRTKRRRTIWAMVAPLPEGGMEKPTGSRATTSR